MQLTQYSQFIISSEVAFLQWGKIVILLNRYTTAMQSNCSCYLKKKKQKKKQKQKKPQPKDWNKNRKYRSQTRKDMHTHRWKTVFLARQWRWKIWNFCMILLRNVCEKDHTDYWPWTNFYSTHANEVGQDGHKNKQEILSFPLFFLLLSLIWAKFPRAIKCSLHNSACSCIKEQRIVLLNASLGTRELLSSSFQLACTRLSVNIDKRRSRRVIKGWGQTWRLQLS